MTALSVQPPFPIITGLDGQPLEDGYIWIGVANLQPIGNPIAVYWDAGLTIPAPLPIRTQGGYPVNSGTPARLYVGSDYSIQVQDKNGSVAYTSLYNNGPLFGGSISSVNVTFLQAGVGAVLRTVQSKLRENVSAEDFGAVGDGITDDTVAIQTALDFARVRDSGVTLTGGKDYLISSPLIMRDNAAISNITPDGSSGTFSHNPTRIIGANGFSGTSLLIIGDPGTAVTGVYVGNLTLQTVPDAFLFSPPAAVACLQQNTTATFMLSCTFENLALWGNYGIIFDRYCQSCELRKISSSGPVDKVLVFAGNQNFLEQLSKENFTGTTADPYFEIKQNIYEPSTNNTLNGLLVQGAGKTNKARLKLNGVRNFQLNECWLETLDGGVPTLGNGIEIVNSVSVAFQRINNIGNYGKISVVNSTNIALEMLGFDHGAQDLSYYVDIDGSSTVNIDNLNIYDDRNLFPLSRFNGRLQIGRYLPRRDLTDASITKVINIRNRAINNYLINPSFEAGFYSWTPLLNGSPVTSFVTSTIAPGNALKIDYTGIAGTHFWRVYQTMVNARVGVPLTIGFWAKVTGGAANSTAYPYVLGGGISSTSDIHVIRSTGEWSFISFGVIPQSAATLVIGVAGESIADGGGNGSVIEIDEISIVNGTESFNAVPRFQSIEFGPTTFVSATAAPATGTWKVGDRAFNSTPVIGQPKSWVCTVAGTPGTWTSEGNL